MYQAQNATGAVVKLFKSMLMN